jgi:hypothetical protein
MKPKILPLICGFMTLWFGSNSVRAQSDVAPPGTIEIRREIAPDGHLRIYCKPIADLTPIEMAVLDPAAIDRLSAKDKRALEEHRSSGFSLPTVNPQLFLSSEWKAYATQQRNKLVAHKARLMQIEAKLHSHDVDFNQALNENDDLSRIVIEDDMASTLTLIGELTKLIGKEGGIPPEVMAKLDVSITTALAGLQSYSAARTADDARRTEKTIEAGMAIKNLLLNYPSLPFSPKERDAVIRGTDALFKLTKISQRYVDGERLDWMSALAAADDVVDAASDLPFFEALKPMRASVQMVWAQWTLLKLAKDQTEIKRARQNHMRAEDFINSQIQQADEWLAVYRSSLSPTGTGGTVVP